VNKSSAGHRALCNSSGSFATLAAIRLTFVIVMTAVVVVAALLTHLP
jgi:hypothetical protein